MRKKREHFSPVAKPLNALDVLREFCQDVQAGGPNLAEEWPDLQVTYKKAQAVLKATVSPATTGEPDSIHAELLIQVAYEKGSVTEEYITEQLNHAADFLANNGLLSGDGPATVDRWGHSVTVSKS